LAKGGEIGGRRGEVDEGFFTSFMKMLVWNVRGLNHPSKQREVQSVIRQKKINLACLIETKVKEKKADLISSFMLPG
jgi:hypothetical protein